MSNVVEFPGNKGSAPAPVPDAAAIPPATPAPTKELIEKFKKLVDDGAVHEFVILGRGVKDGAQYYYCASPGVTLADLLMMKQVIGTTADDLWRAR